ncbi:MAG: hypothetical protein IKY83_08920 [Proteobacteria bacterium]|nr:hypothetical protein [Pseudomonadota bacterium]
MTRSAFCMAVLSVMMSACSLTDIRCPDQTDCDGACVDLQTDNAHCGVCGNECKGGEKCMAGVCSLSCPDKQVDCGETCADLTSDVNHCGSCGNVCKDGEKCVESECVVSCLEGQMACDGVCVDLKRDSLNCGGCGQICMDIQICEDGTCVCPDGTTACDSKCLDFGMLNLDNCTECKQGFCDPNGDKSLGCKSIEDLHVTACSSTYVTCDSTHLDCDQRNSNGCETEIGNENCGLCGYTCESGRICRNGQCEVTCAETDANCDGRCLNLKELHRSDCDTCEEGFCNHGGLACNAMDLLHVSACSAGAIECDDNYLDCDGNIKNGCEINKNTNENCGACGNRCPDGQVCSNGVCATTCGNGLEICGDSCVDLKEFHLKDCSTCEENFCDSDHNIRSNGCEVDAKGSDSNHCGACGKTCDVANADNYCVEGECKFHCHLGYHEHENACEEDSVDNCSKHGKKCEFAYATNIRCESGECKFDCEAGSHQYGSSCEQDSVDNCSMHGVKCQINHGISRCEKGKCVYTCDKGYHLYGESCEVDSASNCGSHGKACSNVAHGTPKCNSGKCDFTCLSDYHKYLNACEADSVSNCGAHGTKCSTVANGAPKCESGSCTFTCNEGYRKNGNACESICTGSRPYYCGILCCPKSDCSGVCEKNLVVVVPLDPFDPPYTPLP